MKEWDEYFLKLAQVVSEKSSDPSTKVGALIVDENQRIISTGYNGLPRKVTGNLEDREFKLAYTVHAELNAILFAKTDLTGCSIYVTHPPCSHCLSAIKQSGIGEIVFPLLEDQGFRRRWNTEDVIDMAYKMELFVREIPVGETN